MKTLSVTQLHKEVQIMFQNNFSMSVCIEGEITSFRGSNSSGHYYFALKDDASSVLCVLFKGRSYNSTILPEMGKKVKLIGTLETYTNPASPSKYQVIVSDIQDIGIGELYRKYLELMKKLGAEGLFDDSKKNSRVSQFPKIIGVVTAQTGAVIHDIIETIKIRYPLAKIILYPTKVQGDDAVNEIIKGLTYMEKREDVDTVILGRGGGSFEDLFCYNHEDLIRYIYSMKKQIISSVGHDQDRPLCDFVADIRASTPTQAAMLATPVSIEDIYSNLEYYLNESRDLYQRFIHEKHQDIDYYIESINKIFRNQLSHSKLKLDSVEKQITLLSYNSVLDRGFSITTKKNGEVLREISEVTSGDKIYTVIKTGKITSTIN